MRKHRKNSPVVVKQVPGVHLTDEDIKDIREAARRLLNKMESKNGRNLHKEDVDATKPILTQETQCTENP